MDDLKLLSKSEEKKDKLLRTVYVFSTDIGMTLRMKKCGIPTMKRGKVVRCEWIKLSNSEVMREVEKEGLDRIKEYEMKEKT